MSSPFVFNIILQKRIFSYDDQAATSRSVITRRQSVAVTTRPETLPSTSRSEILHSRRGTLTTNDQPKPLPSTSKKKDFLKDIDFSDIDYIVSQVRAVFLSSSFIIASFYYKKNVHFIQIFRQVHKTLVVN